MTSTTIPSPSRSSKRGQVLILLVGFLFLGGASAIGVFAYGTSIKELRSRVKHVVVDPARADAAAGLLKKYEDAAEARQKQSVQAWKDVHALLQRQDATREEFAAAWARVDAGEAAFDAEFIATRDALKQTVSREEWSRIFRPPAD